MKSFLLPLISLMLLNSNSFSVTAKASTKTLPTIIFLNGDIYTQEPLPLVRRRWPSATAAFVAIGSNDEIRKLKQSHTEVGRSRWALCNAGFQRCHMSTSQPVGWFTWKLIWSA